MSFSDDRYEWCGISLEHRATRKTIESDDVDDQVSGHLEISEDSLEYGPGPGVYDLKADCYFSGSSSTPVVIKWGSRTRIDRVTRSKKVVRVSGIVRRYNSDWVRWKGARVTLQRATKKGWKNVKTVRSGKKGLVTVQAKVGHKQRVRLVTREAKRIAGSTSPARR